MSDYIDAAVTSLGRAFVIACIVSALVGVALWEGCGWLVRNVDVQVTMPSTTTRTDPRPD